MSESARRWAVVLAITAIFAWSLSRMGFFEDGVYAKALRNLGLFSEDFFPPDFNQDIVRDLSRALVETLEMAYVGTLIGAVFAVPLAVLSARSLTGPVVGAATRGLLAFIRTVPTLLWALVFVIMVGLGPRAGVLGIAVYTIGYMGKLYSDTLEGVDPDVLEAVRATGASKWQLVRHAVIPETGNALVSQLLFLFEYNVRASSVLGFVGAGGIGVYLFGYLQLFEYAKLATTVLLLLAVVIAIEALGRIVRKRFIVGRAEPG